MAEVTFGSVTFDPVEPSDFRGSIEGASGTGKTNTLAVLLEDLADTNIPMFAVDEVGSLSTVRNVDDNIIVVGAPGYESMTLQIPVGQLHRVAELVYDRGMKVMLAANTYEGDPEEPSQEHRAVANALAALYSKAEDRYMGGERRKVLTVIDEAHVLCPEKGAEHIAVDEEVRRARAEIVTLATRGGNYGMNVVLAYQRRAYIQKGALTQVGNWVVHNLEAGDRKTAANQLNIKEETIQGLDPGEALIYGEMTDRQVVGPTHIRKRDSPDPREETFDLPDTPPDLESAIEEFQADVEAASVREEERKEQIEQLRDELESKDETIAELREEVSNVSALRRAFDRAAEGGEGGVPPEVTDELERLREVRADLEDDLAEARSTIEDEADRIDTLEDENERLEHRVAELEAMEEQMDAIEAGARQVLQAIGREDPDAADAQVEVQELRDRVAELEADNERLRQEADRARQEGGDIVTVPQQYEEFYEHPVVEEAIDAAIASNSYASERAAWGLILAIAEAAGPVDYEEVSDKLGYADDSQVKKAAKALRGREVIELAQDQPHHEVDFNFEGMEEIERKNKMREEMDRKLEEKIGT